MASPNPSLPLMVWLSPAFPVGAFAYSHGLEWAVESGDVTNAVRVEGWIADLVTLGSGRNDAILVAAAWHAASASDPQALAGINELALALSPSRERRLETAGQGTAFVTAIRAAWPCKTMDLFGGAEEVAYPVALGAASAGHGIELPALLEAFLLGFVANLVSAAVRLGPIGQTDGQRILAQLLVKIRATASIATQSSLDDLGSATLRSDIASMRHETQYSRLFRS